LEIGLRLSQGSVHPAAFIDPLALLQVVKRRLPTFWHAENKKSDVLVRCVKRSHGIICFGLADDARLTENILYRIAESNRLRNWPTPTRASRPRSGMNPSTENSAMIVTAESVGDAVACDNETPSVSSIADT